MNTTCQTEEDIAVILTLAEGRAAAKALPYAGEVTPLEAYQLQQAGAKVIDVRYPFEHEYVGRVVGSHLVSWKLYPEGSNNPKFVEQLRNVANPDDVMLLLCRSGVRSHAAGITAAEAGFTKAYNIIGGFEGDLDASGKRGQISGWRHAGLDWEQS